jgi:hypothetical protein
MGINFKVIQPFHWTTVPLSSITKATFPPNANPGDISTRANDTLATDAGKVNSGFAQITMGSAQYGALNLKCVGEFENFEAIAVLPADWNRFLPSLRAKAHQLQGLERVDDATVASAIAEQPAHREARAAAAQKEKQAMDAAAAAAAEQRAAREAEQARIERQVASEPVGSLLFCVTDPKWMHEVGATIALDRQRFECHLVGKPNLPPIDGATLLTTGWTVVSESRNMEQHFQGPLEITSVTLKKISD